MSCTAYQIASIRPYASSAESTELFPDSIQTALNRIEEVSRDNGRGPSADNVEWAKKVLLRVLPRYYLLGAEIDAFQNEIHVNWENGPKRVTVFLPAPNQIKVYYEDATTDRVEHHLLGGATDPWAVSGVLRWLFR